MSLGEWDRAEQLITRGLELDPPLRHTWHLRRLQTWLWLWRGEIDEAGRSAQQVGDQLASNRPDPQYRVSFARVAAEVALMQGEAQQAWAIVARALDEPGRALGCDLPLLAVGARALGARSPNGVTRRGSRRAGAHPAGPDRDLGAVGILGRRRQRRDRRRTRGRPVAWGTVLDQDLGPAYEFADARYRLARAWLGAGDRDGAAEALRAASADAVSLGSGLLGDLVDDLARRARLIVADGAGPARVSGGTTTELLTAREREVPRLVMLGGLPLRVIAGSSRTTRCRS